MKKILILLFIVSMLVMILLVIGCPQGGGSSSGGGGGGGNDGGGNGHNSTGSEGKLNDLWKYDGTNWTWISGDDTGNQAGVYGAKGIADPSNKPGSRGYAASWIDSSNNLWLFGGSGYDSAGNEGLLNDLWKYDGTNWTWVSDDNTIKQAGVYGTKGTANPSNKPGSRSSSSSWIDSSNNLWLFGGEGYNSTNMWEYLNDLWKYDGTNWTWVSGDDTGNQAGIYGTKGTADPSNKPGSHRCSISWIDSSNNLWLFGGSGYDSTGTFGKLNDLWKYDGTNWTWVSGDNIVSQAGVYGTKGIANPSNKPGSRGYAASWIDSSNNLWLFGGIGYDSTGTVGTGFLNDLWKYDGTNWIWISGDDTRYHAGVYGTKGIASTSNKPGSRGYAVSWIDSNNNLWLFGGWGYDNAGTGGYLNDLWKYDGTNWTWISGNNIGDKVGIYGTKGIAGTSNKPGSREGAVSWIDLNNNLWLFGGLGYVKL